MNHKKSGNRLLTEEHYQEIKEAIEKIAEGSKDLSAGLEELREVIGKCCIHLPGDTAPQPRPQPGPHLPKRAS